MGQKARASWLANYDQVAETCKSSEQRPAGAEDLLITIHLCFRLPPRPTAFLKTQMKTKNCPDATCCSKKEALPGAQALLTVATKPAQQMDGLQSVQTLLLAAHCFAAKGRCYASKLFCFDRAQWVFNAGPHCLSAAQLQSEH